MEMSDSNFFQSLSYINFILLLTCTVRFYSVAAMQSMKGTTTGSDLFTEVIKLQGKGLFVHEMHSLVKAFMT